MEASESSEEPENEGTVEPNLTEEPRLPEDINPDVEEEYPQVVLSISTTTRSIEEINPFQTPARPVEYFVPGKPFLNSMHSLLQSLSSLPFKNPFLIP